MGSVDFRVGGEIFATLASQHQGYGNLMLTLEQQEDFVREALDVSMPIPDGWGRMGMTKPATKCWPALCAPHGASE
jgi:hypothetical protein